MPLLQEKAYLLFPLLAAMLYAVAAIALKTASNRGVGSARTIFVSNWFIAVFFLVFYDWASFPSLPTPWWPVAVMAVFFILGQIFTVLAVSRGEISCVTPVLGVKVIMVAFMVAFVIGAPVGLSTWIGGVLAALGIACLQVTDKPHDVRRNLLGMLFAFLAATHFAAFDSMNQHWSPIVGFGRLVPPAMIVAALLSFTFVTRGGGRWRGLPRIAWVSLLVGAFFMGLQSVVLIRSIGVYGDAAGANVVYCSRGLWGIALVWLVGHWFENLELKARQRKVICARVLGAALVTAAILLVLV